MKKNLLRLAAMTAASVLPFLLCGTAASASTESVNDYKQATSILVEYTVSGLTVGDSYSIVAEAPYDAELEYCGYIGDAQVVKQDGSCLMLYNTSSAPSATVTIAKLKLFWTDSSFSDPDDALKAPKILIPSQSDSYTIEANLIRVGDIDNSKTVNETDVSLLAEYLAGSTTLDSEARKRADVDLDGDVTMFDLVRLRTWIASTDNTPIWGAN